MAGPSLARRAARAGVGVVPPSLRSRLFRSLAPVVGVAGHRHGLASLVVVVEAVDEPRLAATLDSIAAQEHGYREVLLAPVGDEGAAAVRRTTEGRRDPRLRDLPATQSWQDAATAGADAAAGRWLMFVRGCDLLLPGALSTLVETISGSGSAMAVGDLVQRGVPEEWLGRGRADARPRAGRGLRPTQNPRLAADLALGNRLIATEVWRAAGLVITPADDWTTSPIIARLLCSADRVDVVDVPVAEFLPDHGRRPFGAMPSSLPDMPGWRRRAGEIDQALEGTPLADGWRHHVRDAALPRFLRDAERATDEEWAELRALQEWTGAADDPDIRAASRTLTWLTSRDRRADVEALARELLELDGELRTARDGDRLLAVWDSVEVPDSVRRLSTAESPLIATVTRYRPGMRTEVDLDLRVEQLDLPAHSPAITARLPDGAEQPVAATDDPAATRRAGRRFQRALAATLSLPPGTDRLDLTVAAGGLVRTTTVDVREPHARPERPDPAVQLTGIAVDGTDLTVRVTGHVTLVDPKDRPIGTATVDTPAIELRDTEFGRPHWLPTGFYRLVADGGVPTLTDELRGALPLDLRTDHHLLRVTVGPAGGVLLHITAPLADDEAGAWAQQQLIEEYAANDRAIDHALFYFESYAGRSATDSPLAIFHELRRRHPDLTAVWGISDHAQGVPDGATPVLIRSRAWYDVLARARCLVVNTDVEPWFRRRTDQVLLQTFHGYPSKGMGAGQWRALDYPPSKVAEMRARGVDSWSVILTPSPEMTRHYREQYDYAGPVLEHGYPRDDDLVGQGREERRQQTRELLGIRDDQTAVLYAPTWREHLATRARGAAMSDLLDVAAASRALGDSHVLLLRGHRFHTPTATGARTIDVTRHPEVNDLILAADVAVLDYSSLRFDFALTRKPMVFLVPDLDEYDAGSRRFLFPFRDSAPGPLIEDTAAVVAEVRDVPTLAARWASELVRFNATYNHWQDGHAAERVVDGLLAMLDDPTN